MLYDDSNQDLFVFGLYPINPLQINAKIDKENESYLKSFNPRKETQNFRVFSHRISPIDQTMEFLFFSRLSKEEICFFWDIPRFHEQFIEVMKYRTKRILINSSNLLKYLTFDHKHENETNIKFQTTERQNRIIEYLLHSNDKTLQIEEKDFLVFPILIKYLSEAYECKGLFLFVFEEEETNEKCYETFESYTNLRILSFNVNNENIKYLTDYIFPSFDISGQIISNYYSFSIIFIQCETLKENEKYFNSIHWEIVINISKTQQKVPITNCTKTFNVIIKTLNNETNSIISETDNKYLMQLSEYETVFQSEM